MVIKKIAESIQLPKIDSLGLKNILITVILSYSAIILNKNLIVLQCAAVQFTF